MSQPRRTIEQLLIQGRLPIKQADTAAIHLGVYPNKRTWLDFFDKALLIIGIVALALSLVFFIAYNWQDLGKIGKFALVEGSLAITIALYVALSFRQRFKLIRQLLLLIASVITGSLLALFGQVYQTGADTWQLFFGWAVLIIPWVVIARFPALWLLWLGLINTCLAFYLEFQLGVLNIIFINSYYLDLFTIGLFAVINFVALNLWLFCFEKQRSFAAVDHNLSDIDIFDTAHSIKSTLHWSTYIVGLVSACFITFLAIFTIFEEVTFVDTIVVLSLWLGWCGFMLWRFYKRSISLLMLTYLCSSVIVVVMSWAVELFPDSWDIGGYLLLTLLLIGMSSISVTWLRSVNRIDTANTKSDSMANLSKQSRGDYD